MTTNRSAEKLSKLILFSAIAPETLRARIRGITDQGHDSFRTHAYINTGSSPVLCWHEAWKDQTTGLWSVTRQTLLNDTLDRKTILPAACFFDALYFCAAQEIADKMSGRAKTTPPEIFSTLTHVHDAALAAGQPFDQAGILHPAAGGRPLTDGQFSLTMLDIAGKTKNFKPDEKIAGSDYSVTSLLDYKPSENYDRNLSELKGRILTKHEEQEQQDRLCKIFKNAAHALTEYSSFAAGTRSGNYTTRHKQIFEESLFIGAVATPLMVITTPLLYMIEGQAFTHPIISCGHTFNGHKKNILKLANTLPDGVEKTLMTEFATAAHAEFYIEWAACIFELCKNGKISSRNLGKGLEKITFALKKQLISAEEHARLKTAYESGTFPPLRDFSDEFQLKKITPLRNALEARIAALS